LTDWSINERFVMSGRILLDTNVIIYALNERLVLPRAEYLISIITEIELLSYSKLTVLEREHINTLLRHFEILGLSESIKNRTISIRQGYGFKLPDSVILATAIESNATLVSNDKQLTKAEQVNILRLHDYIGLGKR